MSADGAAPRHTAQRQGDSGRTSRAVPRVPAWRRAPVLLLALALFVAVVAWGFRGVGHWLVVADPLDRAQAVVVLGGHVPFRAMEAAQIYRQGWAPEVWLTRAARSAEEAAMARLNLTFVSEDSYNRAALERLGVPREAIRVLSGDVRNTAEEVRLIAQELERVAGKQVILVTSKPHTRRARAIWTALVRKPRRAIVRYAPEDPYEPAGWWRHTAGIRTVSREVFGLVNLWAGLPLRPDRR